MSIKNNADIVHPNLVWRLQRKTEAKIGEIVCDIVEKNRGKKNIEIPGILEICRKYRIGTRTFNKYLKSQIFQSSEALYNQKILYFSENEIILTKEIMYLKERYEKFSEGEKNLLKLLLEYLGRTL